MGIGAGEVSLQRPGVRKRSGAWRWAAFGLGLLSLILTWERFHTYWEPQQSMVTTAALIGHGLLEGRPLYSDLWDCHPPAFYGSYAFAEALSGYGPYSIFLLNLLIAWALMGALYALGCAYGGIGPGLIAAGLWALISGDPALWANQPLPQTFVNLFTMWALFFIFGEKNKPRWIAVGLLLAGASLYQVSVLVLALFWSLACAAWGRLEPVRARGIVKGIGWVWGGLAGVWGVTLLYFWASGRGSDFIGAVFSYPLYRLAQSAPGFTIQQFWPEAMKIGTPFLLAAFWGTCLSWTARPLFWILLAATGGWVFVETSCASFSPASYQCWLPVLALGGACGIWEVGLWLKTFQPRIAWIPAGLLFLFAFCQEWPNYQKWAVDWSRIKAGEGTVETYDLALNLKDFLKPGETFYEWGDESQLYYLTRQDPPSGVLLC
ncbi:MAG: hypothetical protein ACREL1_01730, partial [bacterium]